MDGMAQTLDLPNRERQAVHLAMQGSFHPSENQTADFCGSENRLAGQKKDKRRQKTNIGT